MENARTLIRSKFSWFIPYRRCRYKSDSGQLAFNLPSYLLSIYHIIGNSCVKVFHSLDSENKDILTQKHVSNNL